MKIDLCYYICSSFHMLFLLYYMMNRGSNFCLAYNISYPLCINIYKLHDNKVSMQFFFLLETEYIYLYFLRGINLHNAG